MLFTHAQLLALKHLQFQLRQAPHKTLGQGGSILPFSGQFSKGTRLMPFFLSVSPPAAAFGASTSHIPQEKRGLTRGCVAFPQTLLTSLAGEQTPKGKNPEGFPEGKTTKRVQHESVRPAGLPVTVRVPARRSNGDLRGTLPVRPPAEDDAGSTVPAQGRRGGGLPETLGDQVKQLRRRRRAA